MAEDTVPWVPKENVYLNVGKQERRMVCLALAAFCFKPQTVLALRQMAEQIEHYVRE